MRSFLWSFVLAVPAVLSATTYGVTTSASAAANQTFDYIIVGGGLTGITVAARLAENPDTSVLVIEAGGDDRKNQQIYDIYQYGNFFGSNFNWKWKTDQGKTIAGGKTLGGGSSINGAAYTRGLNAQYDAWSTLLESSEASVGWNWQSMWSYMKKAETFSAPNDQQAAKGAQSIASYHGYSGPIQVTFPDLMYGGAQQPAFIDTMVKLTGIKHYKDLNGGTPNCVSMTPLVSFGFLAPYRIYTNAH
jgi:choline dehydrogenase